MTAATTPASAPPDSIGRFIAGDPIRALLAIGVVGYHVAVATMERMRIGGLEEAYGPVGEYIVRNGANVIFGFFLVSGYLLGRPFVRAFVLNRQMPNVRNYARNRISRILPAAWIAITVTYMLHGVAPGTTDSQLFAVYAFAQNYVSSPAQVQVIHLWSVNVEALYYLFLPFVAYGLLRAFRHRGTQKQRLWFLLGVFAAIAIASIAWRAGHAQQLLVQRRLPALLFAICIGMALGALEIPGVAWARKLRSPRVLGGAMFFAGWAVILFAPLGGSGPGSLRRTLGVAVGWALIMGGPLIQQWGGAGALRILDNRVMHAIGRWSYSIYLFHLLVLREWLSNVHTSSASEKVLITLGPVLLCAIAVGALGFQLIEKPCMRFRGFSTQPTTEPRHIPPNVPETAAPEAARP
jgi:acetyltransferase